MIKQNVSCIFKIVLLSFVLFFEPANAQSFYVDTGYDDVNAPSSNFSAAAISPGVWNAVRTTPFTLTDTQGVLSGVILNSSPKNSFNGYYHNAGTSGDDSILMDDSGSTDNAIGAFNTLTLSGLQAGSYKIYTYAWQPGFPTLTSASVDVNNSGSQLIVPVLATFAGYEQGENYSLHHATIEEGEDLNIVVTALDDGYDYASYNGFQVILLEDLLYDDGFEALEVP